MIPNIDCKQNWKSRDQTTGQTNPYLQTDKVNDIETLCKERKFEDKAFNPQVNSAQKLYPLVFYIFQLY